MFNFDQVTNRHNTDCVKWDECSHPDMLPLWVADMDFTTAPAVQEAVVRRATHGCYGYTLVPDSYYQAIQDWFATRHQWNIERNDILYTIGVVPAIAATIKACCQVGDSIVLLTPIYNCFFYLVRNAGCQAIELPLVDNGKQQIEYSINWEKFEAALSQPKTTLLLFCNPHNPAGHRWSKEELQHVASLCKQHGVTVISDEIHNELTPPGTSYTPWGTIGEEFQEHAVICTSPSKSFNIAGLQNANIICHNPDLLRRIDRAINMNETCDVNPFGVVAVTAAYNEGGEWLDELRTYIYDNYKFAVTELNGKLPDLRIADLQGTYLMWVDCNPICKKLGINVEELCNRLRIDAHVWFCAGSIYGQAGEGFIRINLACPRATLTEAINRFIGYIRNI